MREVAFPSQRSFSLTIERWFSQIQPNTLLWSPRLIISSSGNPSNSNMFKRATEVDSDSSLYRSNTLRLLCLLKQPVKPEMRKTSNLRLNQKNDRRYTEPMTAFESQVVRPVKVTISFPGNKPLRSKTSVLVSRKNWPQRTVQTLVRDPTWLLT